MRERGLDDEADAGPGEKEPDGHEHQGRDQQHEAAVGVEVGAVDREQRPVEHRGDTVGHREQPPGHLHALLDDEGEPEREEQLGDVTVPVYPAQRVHLDDRAQGPAQDRGDHQRGPEADEPAQREGEVGSQHVHAGMGEVEDAHHREDEREAARQHEQQHAVDEAVEQRDEQDFQGGRPGRPSSSAASCCRCWAGPDPWGGRWSPSSSRGPSSRTRTSRPS